MRPAPRLVGLLVAALAVQAGYGQLPRPPKKGLALSAREFPIPFPGYNQAYRHAMAFSPDGALLATGAGSQIVVFDVETGKPFTRMRLPTEQYAIHVAFTEDGKSLVSSGSDDVMVRFWDVKTGKQKRERLHAGAPKELPPRDGKRGERGFRNPFLSFGPGARRMAVYYPRNWRVEVVDTADGTVKTAVSGNDWRGACVLSPDGKLLTANRSSSDGALVLWDVGTGKPVRTINEGKADRRNRGNLVHAHFSHGGHYLLAQYQGDGGGRDDYYLGIWGVKDGTMYCRLPAVYAHPTPGEISPDGRMFLDGSQGHFFLWDLLADRRIEGIKLPTPHFYHVERSPDGKTLALLGLSSKGESRSYSVYLAPFPTLGDDAIPKDKLTPDDLADLWTGLSSTNLFRRRYVTDALKAHAGQAVELVGGKVKAAPVADQERVVGLLKQCEDDDFEVRERAMKGLNDHAHHFEPMLRQALKDAPAGETRNRVSAVLAAAGAGPTPAGLTADLGGIELLEKLATPAARKLLASLAGGAGGARITAEAASALKRLTK